MKWNGDGTKLDGVVGKILLPSLISPIIAIVVAFTGCWLVHKVTQSVMHRLEERYFRYGQVGSASLVSIAHGTNDAQKTMGVMTLALIASGHWTSTTSIPVWVKVSAATAIAARHLPRRLADHPHPRQGPGRHHPPPGHVERRRPRPPSSSRPATSGFALSTTHVATGSVLGGGLGRGTPVRWSTAGRMVIAWAMTFPIAALIGALMWWIGDSVGGAAGAAVVFLILVGVSTWIFRSSRREHVGADNVNDTWERAAEITSPAYEHARPEHPEPVDRADPSHEADPGGPPDPSASSNGSVPPPSPNGADPSAQPNGAAKADQPASTETKTH